MRLEQIKYLLDISKNNSITKTAEQNFISQQSLFKSIKSLEKELGCSLYKTASKKVYLTAAGSIVCNYGENIIKNYDAMLQSLASLSEPKDPVNLKILSFTALTNIFIADCINFFNKNMPNVNIQLSNISSYTLSTAIDSIKKSDSDLIFISINEEFLANFVKRLANHIYSYEVLLEDEIVTLANKSSTLSPDLFADTSHPPQKNSKAMIFSFIPEDVYVRDGEFFNISSDLDFLKKMLKYPNSISCIPLYLAKKCFKPKQYNLSYFATHFKLSHICIFKTPTTPVSSQFINYVRNIL